MPAWQILILFVIWTLVLILGAAATPSLRGRDDE